MSKDWKRHMRLQGGLQQDFSTCKKCKPFCSLYKELVKNKFLREREEYLFEVKGGPRGLPFLWSDPRFIRERRSRLYNSDQRPYARYRNNIT
jgi:hypothetical protein